MSIGVGGIVSLGGGSSGSGSTSGIQSINSQTGPAIVVTGVNGVSVTAAGNVITINAAGASGAAGPATTQSGVIGVNGITVEQVGGNFVVNGAALSGLIGTGTISGVSVNAVASYSAQFSNLTSGIFSHNFNTRETLVQVYDDSAPPRVIFPDEIISENLNEIGIIFNRPQTGRIVIHGPSGVISANSSGGGSGSGGSTECYSLDFVNVASVTGVHNFDTLNVITEVFDTNGFVIIPDSIQAFDTNTVIVGFNKARSGKLVIHGCSTASSSGVNKISQSFTSVSSINISHFLSTEDVIVQVRDNATPPKVIMPDSIVMIDSNTVSVTFNTIRSGRVTIVG